MAGKSETLTLNERITINGAPAEATLTAAGELRWDDGGDWCLDVESEVLGYETEGTRISVKAFVRELKGGANGGGERSSGRRVRRDYVLEMPTEDSAIRWSDMLGDVVGSLGRPKRLFVILNPYGGRKGGKKVFDQEVRPLLEAANIHYTLQETRYRLHAREVASSMELGKYDGIVCVSGDGVLGEVVNGLLEREDWESAIKIPLGIIPGGTGNGMAKSLLDSVQEDFSVSNATFAVIRGHKRSLDIAAVSQGDKKYFGVMMLTWGLMADIDIESEKYRWMGSARIHVYGFFRFLNLRKYHGSVQYVPAPGYEAYGKPIKQSHGWKGENLIRNQCQENDAEVQKSGYQGSANQLEGLEWRSIDGPFIYITISNVPWTNEDMISAPDAKFSDGYLDATIIRDCPRSTLAPILLKLYDGSYVKSPYVIYIKVKAFRLEPGQLVGNPGQGGIIDFDGEVIAKGEGACNTSQEEDPLAYGPPIQLKAEKGLATIYSPI